MTTSSPPNDRARWMALMVLCLGDLMIVLDSTIVNVALPSIGADLGFSETSLVWVVNAYLLTFGGFLLLGGKLGDLFGHRRLFLIGITVFTAASAACGLAPSQEFLIVARAAQGVGGAVVSAVALSLLMIMFTAPGERAKAMGIFGFVMAGGGSLGVILGGVLTDALDWHWIFLVNLPVGVAVFAACIPLLPRGAAGGERRVDVLGAVTVTASLMCAVYAIVDGEKVGWTSGRTLGLLGAALLLFVAFIVIELRSASPLVPLSIFRRRNISTANGLGVLWASALFAWFFLSAFYMQKILGYDPLEVGLAYLPATVIMAGFSVGLSARLVMRFGTRLPVGVGMVIAAAGLVLFSRAPVDGSFLTDVLPAMILLGIGAGTAFNPLLLAAMSDAEPSQAGLASGAVNTSFMMGGALGLAILGSIAAARTSSLESSGEAALSALNGGYQLAFLVGAAFALLAAGLAVLLRSPKDQPARDAAVEAESVPVGAD